MSLLFALKGRKGDKGDEGDPGDKGDKGDKGDTGEAGAWNYVDRGDVSPADFTTGNFTKDVSWHELDLASIVPENAVGVFFRVEFQSSTASANVYFKTYASGATMNYCHQRTPYANRKIEFDCFLPLVDNRKIKYMFDNVSYAFVEFVVKGWLIA